MVDTIKKGFTIGSIVFVGLVIAVCTLQVMVLHIGVTYYEMSFCNSLMTSNIANRIMTVENIVVKVIEKFFDAQ